MKNKKAIIIFSVLIIIILIAGYFGIKYAKEKQQEVATKEYTPQEEITDDQYRQTIVSLYFINKETKKVEPEARLIDIKEIYTKPYEKLVKLLIEGPKNSKLERLIPEGTNLLGTYMEKDSVVIDLSKEFLNYNKEIEKQKENMIDSIVKTLTELTEVNKVKILIDGNENLEFNELYTRK